MRYQVTKSTKWEVVDTFANRVVEVTDDERTAYEDAMILNQGENLDLYNELG